MIRIEITDENKTVRAKWSWTSNNEKKAADILYIFDELKEWWPLTARQAYYRLISSEISKGDHWRTHGNPNNGFVRYYDTMGRLLKWMRIDERLPWEAIIDEHRSVTDKLGFQNCEQFIRQEMAGLFTGFNLCLAQKQDRYIELWIEKAALLHIVKPIADKFCRRVVCCRGYDSVTFQAAFHNRAVEAIGLGQLPTVLYLGDWDPSGVNMIKAAVQTLQYELDLFGVEYWRCGINPEHFVDIPADPVAVKDSDTRSIRFIEEHGPACYELDAFHPTQLQALVRQSLEHFTDMTMYHETKQREANDMESILDLKAYMHRSFRAYG